MDLKWITQMAERVRELEEENKRLKGLLGEQDNKQALDMTKPQPCTRFRNDDDFEWVVRLSEGLHEVIMELSRQNDFMDKEKEDDDVFGMRLAERLTNIITVCTSWLDAMAYDEELRGEVQRRVNEKNKARGHF